MAQEDRLKKQIEELARVLGKAVARLINMDGGSVSDPIESIAQQVKEEADLDLKKLISVPTEELIKTITSETNLKKDHLEIVADIFFEAEKYYNSQGQEEQGRELYRKAIILLQHMTVIDKTYNKDREKKIMEIGKLSLQ